MAIFQKKVVQDKNDGKKTENRKKCLVLVEMTRGIWTACTDSITERTQDGIVMVRVAELCERLGLSLEGEGKQVKMMNADLCFNRYTIGRQEYTFSQNGDEVIRYGASAAYGSVRDKSFCVAPNSLRTLLHYQSYSGGQIADSAYAEYDYDTVLAFSLFGEIMSRPAIGSVVTDDGSQFERKFSNDRKGASVAATVASTVNASIMPSQPVVTSGTPVEKVLERERERVPVQPEFFTMFNGRRIRRVQEFRMPSADIYWADDKDMVFVEKEGMKGFVEEGCGVVLLNSGIFFNTIGNYKTPCIKLSVDDDAYKIKIYTDLGYSETDERLGKTNYSNVKHDFLKLICYKISSLPNALYDAIVACEEEMDAATLAATENVPQDAGDCSWKRYKEDGCMVYEIY